MMSNPAAAIDLDAALVRMFGDHEVGMWFLWEETAFPLDPPQKVLTQLYEVIKKH